MENDGELLTANIEGVILCILHFLIRRQRHTVVDQVNLGQEPWWVLHVQVHQLVYQIGVLCYGDVERCGQSRAIIDDLTTKRVGRGEG